MGGPGDYRIGRPKVLGYTVGPDTILYHGGGRSCECSILGSNSDSPRRLRERRFLSTLFSLLVFFCSSAAATGADVTGNERYRCVGLQARMSRECTSPRLYVL